jgi:hypothetical protein
MRCSKRPSRWGGGGFPGAARRATVGVRVAPVPCSMPDLPALSIGVPGQPWGAAERARWLTAQVRRRDYGADVLGPAQSLAGRFELQTCGEIGAAGERYPLLALRSRGWRDDLPVALVTGGVHGYETSGVHGALAFAAGEAARFDGAANLLVVPCVSPWAYERIHRWNADAADPNRAFRAGTAVPEAAALMQLVAPLSDRVLVHVDLHETTDSDETEFRPALAARDGQPFLPGHIPDGFYVVGDAANPQLPFQRAIIAEVAQVTHIAPPDARGEIIGSPVVAEGVILYPFRELGLCAGLTEARYTTTTEVYPDSARATPARCIAAQVAAVRAALTHALANR